MAAKVIPGFQAAFEQAVDPDTILEFFEVLGKAATTKVASYDKDGNVTSERYDVGAMRLFAEYAVGKPRKRSAPVPTELDTSLLATVEGCREYAILVTKAECAGVIDPELAESCRRMTEIALRTHHQTAAQDQGERLADAGAESIILDASDQDVQGQIETAVTYLRGSVEGSDG